MMEQSYTHEMIRKNAEISKLFYKHEDEELVKLQARSIKKRFDALVKEGFSKKQAFTLVCIVLGGNSTPDTE